MRQATLIVIILLLLALLYIRSAADSSFPIEVQSAQINGSLTFYRVKDLERETVCYILDGYGKAGISCPPSVDWERAYLPVAVAP